MLIKTILSAIFLVLSATAFADDECIARASERYGVPDIIIKAIIQTESGGKAYAINVQGKPYFPESLGNAMGLIKANEGKSFDVGLMQVNIFWFKRFGIFPELGLSECFNINFGTWILAYEIQNHGLNLKAVGKYHSPDSAKGGAYSSQVLREMIKILNRG